MREINKKFLLVLCFLTIPFFISNVIAQPPPPDPNAVPVHGLGILAVLGIVYGVVKLRKKNK
ncbi:MAG TPA: hypothetical protein PKW80_15605 [Bacteroidales bacterium]|nr:hypothetical protein [Bacteroidales bacterium]